MFSFQLDGGMSAKLSSFKRPVRDHEVQDDDLKMGVVILGMYNARVKEHFTRNIARLDNPRPLGKGKEKGKAKATPPPPEADTRQPSKAKAKSPATLYLL